MSAKPKSRSDELACVAKGGIVAAKQFVSELAAKHGRLMHQIHAVSCLTGTSPHYHLSYDGQWLAASDYSRTWLWSVEEGRLHWTCEDGGSVFMAGNRRFVAMAGRKRTKVIDGFSGLCLGEFLAHTSAYPPLLSADGRFLVVCDDVHSDHYTVVNTTNGACVMKLERTWCVYLSSDGERVVTLSHNNVVKIWSTEDGRCLKTIRWLEGRLRNVFWSSDGRVLGWADEEEGVRICDLLRGRYLMFLPNVARDVGLPWFSFSTDGRRIAARTRDNKIGIWDFDGRRNLGYFDGTEACLSGDGRRVLVAKSDSYSSPYSSPKSWDVNVWDIAEQRRFSVSAQVAKPGHYTVNPEEGLLVSCGYQGGIDVWSLTTGRLSKAVAPEGAFPTQVDCVSANGRRAIRTTDAYGTCAEFWDTVTGQCIWFDRDISKESYRGRLSYDGAWYVRGGPQDGRWEVGVVDTQNRKRLRTFEGAWETFSLSADEARLATRRGHAVKVWEIKTGALLLSYEHEPCVAGNTFPRVHLDRQGTNLVTISEKEAKVWSVASGTLTARYDYHTCAFFDVSGDYLLVDEPGPDGQFSNFAVWHIGTGTAYLRFRLSHPVGDPVSLWLDQEVLVSCLGRSVLCFWDIGQEELLGTFYNLHRGFLWTTPPDEAAPHGWFWTDRPELIHVIETDEDGSNSRALADDDPRRVDYIAAHNRQDIVMARINNWPLYERLLNKLLRKQKCLQEGSAVRHTVKMIEAGRKG